MQGYEYVTIRSNNLQIRSITVTEDFRYKCWSEVFIHRLQKK